MADRLKYVILDTAAGRAIFMFPAHIEHAAFANMVKNPDDEIISAGFVFNDALNPPRARPGSTSLGIVFTPKRYINDTKLLLRELGWSAQDIRTSLETEGDPFDPEK